MRLPAPGKADISRFSGKYLLIRGTISQTSSLATGNGLRLVINCRAARESILPVSLQNVPDEGFAPVEGNLQAIVYTCRRAALNSAPKNMLPPAQINLPFAPGDCILLRGKVINLACAPGERLKHIAFLLRRQAVFCQLVTTKANIVLLYHGCLPQANWLDSQAVYWRQALVQFHRSALGVHDGDLLSSMVLGDRAVSPEREIVDNFRASGLSHILAASGFNLSIVATSIYFVLRF